MKTKSEEIRRRFPRIVMNLVMTFIFWIMSAFIPPTIQGTPIPGLNADAGFLVWIVTMVIMAIFLIRALADALVLGDFLTDIVVKRLGIKEELSPRRAARDFIYIIVIILIATALSPIVGTVENLGHILTAVTTYVALGLIIVLIYDIGRIIYRIIEQKAELLADRLARIVEKDENSE